MCRTRQRPEHAGKYVLRYAPMHSADELLACSADAARHGQANAIYETTHTKCVSMVVLVESGMSTRLIQE